MLIDHWHEFNAKHHRLCPTAVAMAGMYRRTAQRFSFSDEATRAAAALVRDYPDLLIRNYQFAVPPYHTTYIEYDATVWANEFGVDKYGESAKPMDVRVGHLLHNDTMITIVANALDPGVGVCPWLYTLSTEAFSNHWGTRAKHKMVPVILEAKPNTYTNELATVAIMLGTTIHHPRVNMTDEIVADINHRTRLWVEHTIKEQHLPNLIRSFVGEVRNAWQLLLLLNQPSHIEFDDIAANRRLIGNKPVAFPSHRLVRIKPKTTVHHIARTIRERTKPGLHAVRAFWRNFDKNDNCVHDWPLLPDEFGQFHCQRCSQWRVHVKQHERGDPARPVARKGYVV